MARGSKSREHHWWPVGLQKYWADKNGDISWISPQGTVEKKRFHNRKIARKAHGHTIFHGEVWETNFEDEFQSADDAAPEVVSALKLLKPFGLTLREFIQMVRLFFKRDGHLKDTCRFYTIDESLHRKLLLLVCSLLIRSPGNRFRHENYPQSFGLPPSESVGKANMRQNYLLAKRICEKDSLSNRYFILIHSFPNKRFVFGDGQFDWLTGSLSGNRIDGRALVPLTPELCVYVCSPRSMYGTVNCASFIAPAWMVDQINDFIQAYSKASIFFSGKPPKLTEAFLKGEFLRHKSARNDLVELLDDLAGITKPGFSLAAWDTQAR